jgi:gamma-F420-2:alpha-L-glutamate ligase
MNKIWILSKKDGFEYENNRLVQSFESKGITAEIVDPGSFDIIVNKDIKQGLRYNGQPVELPQLLLVRFGAGISKFMLALIRQLEKAGVVCINSADAIECVKDKLHTSQILSQHSIAIPNTMMVRFPVDIEVVKDEIGFPCVVKIITGSYGEGVYLLDRKKDFVKLMEFIETLKSSKTLIVQEYMGDRPGEDLRVLVIGGKVIGAMKRTAPEGDFRANITNGGTGESYPLTDEIEYIARETAKVLNLDIAGIDLLFDARGFRVCEANSNPGFSGFETYCGIDVADVITDYIKFKLS